MKSDVKADAGFLTEHGQSSAGIEFNFYCWNCFSRAAVWEKSAVPKNIVHVKLIGLKKTPIILYLYEQYLEHD